MSWLQSRKARLEDVAVLAGIKGVLEEPHWAQAEPQREGCVLGEAPLWDEATELLLSLLATNPPKNLCQGGKRPAGESGKQAHHCLPLSDLPRCFALAGFPLA